MTRVYDFRPFVSKILIKNGDKNEEALKKFATDKVNDLKKMEEKSRSVEKSLNEKLAAKSQEIEKLRMENDSLQSKLDAQTKIMQMKIHNLETSLKNRIEENKQLTEICDNLLASMNGLHWSQMLKRRLYPGKG